MEQEHRHGGAGGGRTRWSRPSRTGPEVRRARLVDAFVDLVAGQGYGNAHVDLVCHNAYISHRDFYRWFKDKHDCYLQLFEGFGDHLVSVTEEAVGRAGAGWEQRCPAGLTATTCALAAQPPVARFLIQAPAVEGGAAAARKLVARWQGFYLTEETRGYMPGVPDRVIEGIAAGIVIHPMVRYIEDGAVEQLPELVPWTAFSLATVLLGPERAASLKPGSRAS